MIALTSLWVQNIPISFHGKNYSKIFFTHPYDDLIKYKKHYKQNFRHKKKINKNFFLLKR